MALDELMKRAIEVREQYANLEQSRHGRAWTREEIALGFVGDVGDLMKLVMASEGIRNITDTQEKLAHELSDCLWSILVLSHIYSVDLERAYLQTMDELEQHIKSQESG